jgi:peptidoglycan/xylan/chitin deacetylase (PgdA/CDA1 family)
MTEKGFALLVIAVIFMGGCIGGPSARNRTWLDEHGGDITIYSYTKAEIEAEINARWREYGYSSRPNKYVAISFDDGPCGPFDNGGTQALLTELRRLNVKATFFVIGQNVRSYRTAARAAFEAGHELGNHSDGYSSLGGADKREIAASIDAASQAIFDITGKYPYFFRAPNLNHGSGLSQVCAERGMPLIDGTTHNDWPGNSLGILASVLDNTRDGDIIILHENNTSKGNTMAVLSGIITGLRERGFWIMTVGQLAAVREQTLLAGERYRAIN